MVKNLNTLLGILFSIIPIAIISGPAVIDIIVVLMGLIFIFLSIYNKDFSYYKSKFIILLFCWNIYLIINSLLSVNPPLSLESSLFYFRFIFFSLAIFYLLNNKVYYLKVFFWVLFFSFIVLILDSFYQLYFGTNILGYPIIKSRISSLFGDELILGSFFSRTFPIFFAILVFLYSKNIKLIIIGFAIFVLLDVIIFIAGERSALFYLFISTVFILIFMKDWKIFRIGSMLLSFIVIIIISIFNSSFKQRVVDYTYNQVFDTDQKIGFNFFSPQHQVIYETSYKIFLDYPLFGIGPKNFRYVCQEEKYKSFTLLDQSVFGCQTSPANYYLQILVETGIVGLLFYISIISCLIFLIFKLISKKKSEYTNFLICLSAAGIISFWPLVPTGSVFNNWISAIIYLPLGMILYAKNRM